MKKTAKILAVLLAVLLGMTTLTSLVYADTHGALPPDEFTFFMHKYLMDDLSQAGAHGTGNITDAANVPAGARPKDGVVFRLYKLYLPSTADRDPREGVVNPNADNAPWDNTLWVELIKAFNNISFILDDYDNPTAVWLTNGLTYNGVTGTGTNPTGTIDNFALLKQGATFNTNGTSSNGTGPVVYWDMPATASGGVSSIASGTLSNHTAQNADKVPLTKGFYVVVEQIPAQPGNNQANDGTDIASISFPFIVSLPMTRIDGANAGKEWLSEIHAYPKNGDVTITKDVDRTSVKLGEIVNWEIIVSVPADIKHYKSFFVTDTIDEALTYVQGSLNIWAMSDVTGTQTHKIVNPATGIPYYEETIGPASAFDIATGAQNLQPMANQMLKVQFIEVATLGTRNTAQTYRVDGRSQLYGDFDNSLGDYTGPGHASAGANHYTEGTNGLGAGEFPVKFIKLTFQTYVNEKVLDRDPASGTTAPTYDHESYTIYNEAFIRFKNRFDRGGTNDGDKPRWRQSKMVEIHTSAIVLLKEDAHTNANLLGAKFQIASSKANALAGNFLKRKLVTVNVGTAAAPQTAQIWMILDVGDPGYATADDWIEESKLYNDVRPGNSGSTAKPGAATGDPDSDSFYLAENWWTKVNGKAVVRFEGLKEYVGVYNHGTSTWAPNPSSRDYMKVPEVTLDGSYWIVEVFAPAGYNLLLDPIELKFNDTNSKKDDTGAQLGWFTIDGGVVRNTNTFTLPRTGGIGTILFTAGGIALIGVAALLFIVGAKKKKQKAQG